jgi:hypothetical protein
MEMITLHQSITRMPVLPVPYLWMTTEDIFSVIGHDISPFKTVNLFLEAAICLVHTHFKNKKIA